MSATEAELSAAADECRYWRSKIGALREEMAPLQVKLQAAQDMLTEAERKLAGLMAETL